MVDFRSEDAEPNTTGRRRGPGRPSNAAKATPIVPNRIPAGQLKDALLQRLNMLGSVALMLDKHYAIDPTSGEKVPVPSPCALTALEQNEKLATALVDAAEKNPALRKILNQFVTVSVFGEILAAMAPVILVVLQNHVSMFGAAASIPDVSDPGVAA